MFDVEFNDTRAVSLYNNEFCGQLSDGVYENWSGGNSRWWTTVGYGPQNRINKPLGRFNYSIDRLRRELFECGIDDRMYIYIKVADKYCELLNQDEKLANDFIRGAEYVFYDNTRYRPDDEFWFKDDPKTKYFVQQYGGTYEQAVDALDLDTFYDIKARRKIVSEVCDVVKACVKQAQLNC